MGDLPGIVFPIPSALPWASGLLRKPLSRQESMDKATAYKGTIGYFGDWRRDLGLFGVVVWKLLKIRRVGRVKRVPPRETRENGGTRFTRSTLRCRFPCFEIIS